MKILLVADEESPYLWDYYVPGRLKDIELILSCGDLKQEYLEFLVTMANAPLYYIPGNHDKGYIHYPPEGCENIDCKLVRFNGLRIAGFGGCIRYNLGVYQYTDEQMQRRVTGLIPKIYRAGGVDIVISHAPPREYGDAEDNAHRGFKAFPKLIDKYHPQYWVHGHVHPSYGNMLPRSVQYGDTTVYNAVGWHVIEVDPPAREENKKHLFGFF